MTNPPPLSAAQLAVLDWHKSSYSAPNNECVEVADASSRKCVRDSKNPNGPVLLFDLAAFSAFVTEIKRSR